jgi:predicted nucleic acid-binding protein
MVNRILFDTNVLIDVLAARPSFLAASRATWQAHVDRKLDGYVAAVSLTNLFYIIWRMASREEAWRSVQE